MTVRLHVTYNMISITAGNFVDKLIVALYNCKFDIHVHLDMYIVHVDTCTIILFTIKYEFHTEIKLPVHTARQCQQLSVYSTCKKEKCAVNYNTLH